MLHVIVFLAVYIAALNAYIVMLWAYIEAL